MTEKTCENCVFSGVYGGNLVCWLYSEDEILYLDEQSKPCSDYDEDKEFGVPYEDSLVRICKEIERKVKKALWKK